MSATLTASDPITDWIASAFPALYSYVWGGGADADLKACRATLARINAVPHGDNMKFVAIVKHESAYARACVYLSERAATLFHGGGVFVLPAVVRGALPSPTRFVKVLSDHFRSVGKMASGIGGNDG